MGRLKIFSLTQEIDFKSRNFIFPSDQ